jgi:hypothetical protein
MLFIPNLTRFEMKFFVIGLLFMSFATAFAAEEVFKIPKITYKGKVYSGALIVSRLELEDRQAHLMKPRVLVYNMRLGAFDAEIELMLDGQKSPLCQNLGFKYTEMHDGVPGADLKLLARFISKHEVQILPPGYAHYSTRSYVSCF